MDRRGPTRPLLIVTALFAVAVAALFAAIETGAAAPVLAVPAFLTGVLQPALTGASRALWGRLVPPGAPRAAAYNYEAISMEVFFILGPGLAAVLVAAPWPGTGLLVAAVAAVVGTAGFALTPAVRAPLPAAGPAPRLGPLGALARPGRAHRRAGRARVRAGRGRGRGGGARGDHRGRTPRCSAAS